MLIRMKGMHLQNLSLIKRKKDPASNYYDVTIVYSTSSILFLYWSLLSYSYTNLQAAAKRSRRLKPIYRSRLRQRHRRRRLGLLLGRPDGPPRRLPPPASPAAGEPGAVVPLVRPLRVRRAHPAEEAGQGGEQQHGREHPDERADGAPLVGGGRPGHLVVRQWDRRRGGRHC